MTPKGLLVCFSGKMGSGKTSTSIAVANALACGYASFGGYLRDLVVNRGGDPDCRQTLQDLGQHLVQQDAESFCRNVLARADFVPGGDFVLDGVRHVQVLEHLDRIAAPSDVRLIFLKADTELRGKPRRQTINRGQQRLREGWRSRRGSRHGTRSARGGRCGESKPPCLNPTCFANAWSRLKRGGRQGRASHPRSRQPRLGVRRRESDQPENSGLPGFAAVGCGGDGSPSICTDTAARKVRSACTAIRG